MCVDTKLPQMASHIWITVILSIVAVQVSCQSQGNIRLVDNGYEGLVLDIDDTIPEQHCNQILNGIKNVLSEFSKQLFNATGRRVSIRDVTIVLPRSWQTTNSQTCAIWGPLTTSAIPTPANIHVSTPHPVFHTRPWVQQSQGCGQPGDYIQLGADLLRASTNDSHLKTAQLLLAEWAKFRWGIFEEQGYEGDVVYPATFRHPSTSEIKPNSCKPAGSKAPFCKTEDHIPEAPNKHNTLCQGKSAWDVIMNSADFKNNRNSPSNNTEALVPNIKFVQAGAPNIILLVEDTAVMNLQRRWLFIRKAVRRVVAYDIPDGAYVGVVVFNSVARSTASLSKMDQVTDVRQRIGSSMPRNPSHIPEKHKCLLCGLQEALRTLDSGSTSSEGATIILITTGSGATPKEEMDEMIHLATERRLHIEVILYPATDMTSNHGLEKLITATHGSVLTVMDEGVGNDSKVTMMVSLMDALLSTIWRLNTPSKDKPSRVVHSQAYQGSLVSKAKGSFIIDDSFAPDAKFSIYYYDLNHVGNTIQLTTPSGKVMSSINMQEEDGDANVIFMNIPMAERGKWHYTVENRADSHQGLVIQVTSHESSSKQITIRSWTSQINNSSKSPVIIYAEIKNGMLPILNARVVAKLQRLGTGLSGNKYAPVYVDLYDSGNGDPDITEGDGVYTRYLPYLAHSTEEVVDYELTITAHDNNGKATTPINNILTRNPRIYHTQEKTCCGSSIQYEHVMSLNSFQRSEVHGVIGIISYADKLDTTPPSRILDLKSLFNLSSYELTLRWTAPGDDYDWGRVHHYEAVLANSWKDALAFEGEVVSGMPVPEPVGSEQITTTLVELYGQIIYINVRAFDEAGNHGGESNIVSVWVPRPPTTAPPPTSPLPLMPSSSLKQGYDQEVTQPIRIAGFNFEDMAVIVGSVAGFLFVVAIIATFCFLHVARRQRQEKNKDKKESSRHAIIKASSTIVIDKDESQDSADSAVKNVEALSKEDYPPSSNPSWSPSHLLQEHERRFSVNSLVSRDLGEISESMTPYENLQEPYPDVTLTGTHSYPSSQASSTPHSDPPAYQPSYAADTFTAYPYNYDHEYSNEELPPYSSQAPLRSRMASQSSQLSAYQRPLIEAQSGQIPTSYPNMLARPRITSMASQCSTPYGNEVFIAPSDLAQPQEIHILPNGMPKYTSDLPGYIHQPSQMYANVATDGNTSTPPLPNKTKVPPPVAPKPMMGNRVPVEGNIEPTRRNITQV
ncbi:unnamed protein product [Meganyctiphanes norvegica]|uniref:VWFA domain-containing protein n=1 Tax=Meganyctiphanes norvegica TaxID=48144 RepID=A0AAV2R6I0_MEGNR